MTDIGATPNPREVVGLLARALSRAGEEADRSPLDLDRIGLCLDITDLHARAIELAWPKPLDPVDIDHLDLTEALERAEAASRNLPLIDGEAATSELVRGLCDAIREVRSRV